MTKKVKPSKRKVSIYLVRSVYDFHGELRNVVELFFNKKDALNYQKHNGGVLTRWSYQEQIELPKRRGAR